MIAVVIKSFTQGTTSLRPGMVVDTAGWRNEDRMVRTRIVRPATASELAAYEHGRTAVDEKPAEKIGDDKGGKKTKSAA